MDPSFRSFSSLSAVVHSVLGRPLGLSSGASLLAATAETVETGSRQLERRSHVARVGRRGSAAVAVKWPGDWERRWDFG